MLKDSKGQQIPMARRIRTAAAMAAALALAAVGLATQSASAAESHFSDQQLLEAVISQTGPAADAAGISIEPLVSARTYKDLRGMSSAVIGDILSQNQETQVRVAEDLRMLRSGDPIAVSAATSDVNDLAGSAVSRLYGDEDSILAEGSSTAGFGGWFCSWRSGCGKNFYVAVNIVAGGVVAVVVAVALWGGSSNTSGSGAELLHDQAIADMTSAWAA